MPTVAPDARVTHIEHLTGGLSNSTYKIALDHHERPLVLRVYERDPPACRKELALLEHLKGIVPVQTVVHAEPDGVDGSAPFVILEYVDGITYRQLRTHRDARALAQASHSLGIALAAVGANGLPAPDVVEPRRSSIFDRLTASMGSAELAKRTGDRLALKIGDLAHRWSSRLEEVSRVRRLVHGDLLKRNVLVRERAGRWEVAAILDWECAFAGTPLVDVATFLRYELASSPVAEPHFSRGFLSAGGRLPDDWPALIKVIDLDGLCRLLASPGLPGDVAAEVVALVEATVRALG